MQRRGDFTAAGMGQMPEKGPVQMTRWQLESAREVYLGRTLGHWPFEIGKGCWDSAGERCLQWETQEETSLMVAGLPLLLKTAQTGQQVAFALDYSTLTTAQLLPLWPS